jgi:hypothetical protein
MYKKITHNIVEEHFDHPIASQIKKSMSRSKVPNNEVFSEIKFRSDINSWFENYKSRINSMINSATGTEEDLIKPFEEIYNNSWVDGLGNMTKPIYASELGERINSSFRSMPVTLLIVIQLLKTGRDITSISRRFAGATDDLRIALINFNPAWSGPAISSLLTTITTEMTNQVKARLKKDANAEAQSTQKIAQAFATFENEFVNGIISQHPERFSKSTPVITPTSYNRDIM